MQNSTRPNRPDLDATKIPTAIDIAWAAGIYEGEGTCRMSGKGKRGFSAAVVQKDPELLYRLREWFGRSINLNQNAGTYVWDICGDRARIFMALIYGLMTVRRKVQIDSTEALDFLGGQSPVSLNAAQLRSAMDRFYAEHAEKIKDRVRVRQAAAYQKRKQNLQVVEISKTA
jgi:hypothetical protein